jgi:Na+:H+ antiporter, NhaA family
VALWLAVIDSGIHATIAGVLLAMTIPARTAIDEDEFTREADEALREFRDACDPESATVLSNRRQMEALHQLERSIEEVQAPLLKMEHALNKLVAFGIMPLFAFANAGVRLDASIVSTISWSVVAGIVFGLVVGKVIGITLASRLAVGARWAELPSEVGWRSVFGASWLGGIGFTMSLFVANLAFGPGALLDSAKVGILAASLIAGSVGALVLLRGRREG